MTRGHASAAARPWRAAPAAGVADRAAERREQPMMLSLMASAVSCTAAFSG